MDVELPYMAEYAKSGRASCKGCKSPIPKDSVRLAIMVQSPFHDGKVPQWYHKDCFFKKQRPASVGDIKNYENLRFADQSEIEKLVGSGSQTVESKSGKKRSKQEQQAIKDFGIEYAKSGRAACRGCELKINKDEVRVSKTVYDTEVGMKYGGQKLWHHLECFAKLRSDVGWFDTGENLPGYKQLKAEEKEEVKRLLPVIKSEDTPDAKKPKLEIEDELEKKEQTKKLKQQNDMLFKFRDELKSEMKKPDIEKLLEYNTQVPIVGDSEKLLDQAADLLTFGAIECCPECKSHQFTFNKFGYACNGNISEWTKCTKVLTEPKRTACKVPNELKTSYKFLSKYKKKPEMRIIQYLPPSASTIAKDIAIKKNPEELDGPKIKRERPPLYNFKFSTIGLKDNEAELKKRIGKLGGKCDSKITDDVIAIISTEKEVEKLSSRMKKAKELGIHIVPMKYLDCVENDGSGAITFINSMTLCDWGTDPSARLPQEEVKSSKSKSHYTKSVPKSVTLKVKNGLAVDPDSGLEDIAHVYVKGDNKYNIVLGLTDIQRNKNSYYKLQLLEADNKNKYWIFRSWGRIGTTIGNSKVEDFSTVIDAVQNFHEERASNTRFIDASNRFYTLIPHNFGVNAPPLIESVEQVESLRQMLDSLSEIEVAYNIIKNEDNVEGINPLDKHYEELKTKLEPLDKTSDEFALLNKYVQNTHASTHSSYELEIIDIFKVARQGEARRYKPFKKLHNRKLLWHGSRLTNFVGILSHGLKIAPPEAPPTGYMFGKGIYFADMVSKSANYCCTSQQNSTGLMLLSEVALGDMMECTAAKYVTQLPKNKHSCYGRGRTMPDPKESIIRDDGVEIPLGKPITNDKLKSSLLYNEFIVYDIAQVNVQYLFRLEFKYKY
ncbi:hypothetical protein ACLKA6_003902 [Drosophila palustris]